MMRDHILLIENLFTKDVPTKIVEVPRTPGAISITESREEFRASWDELPSKEELGDLFETIKSGPLYEAYYLNRMVFLNRRQALVAINSLARDAD